MKVTDIDDQADDAATEDMATKQTGLKIQIEENEADIPTLTVVEQSIPAILVDRKKRKGRVRTSDATLRIGPEEQPETQRALVVRENGEEIMLLGAPLIRFVRSIA